MTIIMAIAPKTTVIKTPKKKKKINVICSIYICIDIFSNLHT